MSKHKWTIICVLLTIVNGWLYFNDRNDQPQIIRVETVKKQRPAKAKCQQKQDRGWSPRMVV